MKKIYNPIMKHLALSLFSLSVLSACGGGGGSDSAAVETEQPAPTPAPAPNPAPAPSVGTCGSSDMFEGQTCITVGERVAIGYAPADSSDYQGVALFLHGTSGSPEKVDGIFGATMLADAFNLVAVTPEGDPSVYVWQSENNGVDDSRDIGFLTELIDKVQGQYGIGNDKVYVFGYSAGGFMAYKMACQMPERLTAVVSLSGQFRGDFDNCPTATAVAVHHLHSHSDFDVPYHGRENGNIASVADTLSFWREKNGCSAETEVEAQEGVTAESSGTSTEKSLNCTESVALSKMSSVSHDADFIPEKLLATFEYLLAQH